MFSVVTLAFTFLSCSAQYPPLVQYPPGDYPPPAVYPPAGYPPTGDTYPPEIYPPSTGDIYPPVDTYPPTGDTYPPVPTGHYVIPDVVYPPGYESGDPLAELWARVWKRVYTMKQQVKMITDYRDEMVMKVNKLSQKVFAWCRSKKEMYCH